VENNKRQTELPFAAPSFRAVTFGQLQFTVTSTFDLQDLGSIPVSKMLNTKRK
jgi:hypothetical protein